MNHEWEMKWITANEYLLLLFVVVVALCSAPLLVTQISIRNITTTDAFLLKCLFIYFSFIKDLPFLLFDPI